MKKKLLLTLCSSILISISISNIASAKTAKFLAQDSDGKYYSYSYSTLIRSSINEVLGKAAPLYADFKLKKLVAFQDDKKGFVKAEDVNKAAIKAVLRGQDFNLDSFTESVSGESILSIENQIKELSEESGKLVELEDTTVSGTVVNVQKGVVPGQTIVVVALPEGVDATEYEVKVNEVALDYDTQTKKFAGVVNKVYSTVEEAQKDLIVEKYFDVDAIY